MAKVDPPVLEGRLLQKASRAAFWNTLFLPLQALEAPGAIEGKFEFVGIEQCDGPTSGVFETPGAVLRG